MKDAARSRSGGDSNAGGSKTVFLGAQLLQRLREEQDRLGLPSLSEAVRYCCLSHLERVREDAAQGDEKTN